MLALNLGLLPGNQRIFQSDSTHFLKINIQNIARQISSVEKSISIYIDIYIPLELSNFLDNVSLLVFLSTIDSIFGQLLNVVTYQNAKIIPAINNT